MNNFIDLIYPSITPDIKDKQIIKEIYEIFIYIANQYHSILISFKTT